MDFHLKRLRNNPKGPHGPIPPKLRARSARPPVRARSARAARRTARKRRPSRPFSAPCRSEERASRNLAGGADYAGENKLGRRHARSVYGFYLPKRRLRDTFLPQNTILSTQNTILSTLKAPAGRISSPKYNFIRPKGPCGTTFCYS